MAKFSSQGASAGGVQVSGFGVRGQIVEGVKATARLRAGGGVDPLLAALNETDGLSVRAEVTLELEGAERGASRAGGPEVQFDETPSVQLSGPDLARGEIGQLAVVEEGGRYTFVLPKPGTQTEFEIPVESDGATGRGFLQKIGQMAVRVIGVAGAKKVISKATELLVRKVEDSRRSHRLRPFDTRNYTAATTQGVNLAEMAKGPS